MILDVTYIISLISDGVVVIKGPDERTGTTSEFVKLLSECKMRKPERFIIDKFADASI